MREKKKRNGKSQVKSCEKELNRVMTLLSGGDSDAIWG